MRRFLIAAIAAGALAQGGTAYAGCWATVGVAPPPDGIAPGETWTARMTVLQHGRTPLPDAESARPTLTIRNTETGATQTFTSRRTKDPTVFQANVVFPSNGSWRYEVFDDFTSWDGQPAPCAQTHTFKAIAIGGSAASGGAGPKYGAPVEPLPTASPQADRNGFPYWPVIGGILAVLAAVGGGGALVRKRRASRAPEVAV
jgi:hypothetical protein